MTKQNNTRADVILIGYERQENLGLRAIIAYLEAHSIRAILIPFFPGNEAPVLAAVRHYNPRVVGFSLIFQYTLNEFGQLMRTLRSGRIAAHFTGGGHFPSLRPEETLRMIPELDSIIRFEGEMTLVELIERLDEPEAWGAIRGLAFRLDAEIVMTELRPPIADLDELPLLARDEPQALSGDIKVAAMLASRGCLFNCSFCSIRQFYGALKGSLRRARSARSVVNEMLGLYRDRHVRFFSFQDDDFAMRSPAQREWLREFLRQLDAAGLVGRIAWKISCRVDDLDREILKAMLDHGLMAVYLGVESGNAAGLAMLNKRVSVAQNIAAINLLKQLNVAMSVGFMLFDPSSTIDSVRRNTAFLKTIGEDGYFPINFCKMLPYAGTPVETMLRNQGRLKGTVAEPDYSFEDPVLDWYEFLVQRAFSRRNFSPDGMVAILQAAEFDWRLESHFSPTEALSEFGASLRGIIRRTNLAAVETLESLLDAVTGTDIDVLLNDKERLVAIYEAQWREEADAEVQLRRLQAEFNPAVCRQKSVRSQE